MWAKRTRACMRASWRGWSSLSPGMRLPLGRRVGAASARSWPRSTNVSRMSCWTLRYWSMMLASFAEAREVLDGLGDPVVGHIVGGGLRPEQEMVADVLLDEAVAVVTADDRVGQVEVFDHGLELAPIPSGHLAAEDGRNFVRLADRSVGIEQALSQAIQGGAPVEEEIVAVLHLGEEQPVRAAGVLALAGRE